MNKRWSIGTAQLGILALVLVGFMITAGGCESTEQKACLEVNDYHWEMHEVDTLTERQERDVLIVDVTVVNEAEQKMWLNSWYATDEAGQRFESTIFHDIPFEEDILYEAIQPSETIEGQIAFEVPKDHLPLWLHFEKCTEVKIDD